MDNASFRLISYQFDKVVMNLENLPTELSLNLNFEPSGIFDPTNSTYYLTLKFHTFCEGKNVIEVLCRAEFEFQENIGLADIPPYFYANSIAIVFPYVRAFVSTLTLQANVHPIMLPTMNLSTLQSDLRANTVEKV